MKPPKHPFTVRGFNVFDQPGFSSIGVIESLSTAAHRVERTELAATVALLRGKPFSTMSARNLTEIAPGLNPFNVTQSPNVASADDLPELQSFDLKITTPLLSIDADDKERLADVVNRWAEKSRVRGTRGFRASAVRWPRWEKDEDTGNQVAYTKVLVGTAVFYSSSDVRVLSADDLTDLHVIEDLGNLTRNLTGLYKNTVAVSCKHSHVGRFEL